MPFENASGDPEHEYLSDGITGSLINILATIPKLRVMAQSTVFRYKGREIDPQAVGRELNVRAVLTGRMMQSGGSLRIGTELVDVATGSQLWGAQYDRKPGDIFVVQDEISNEISGKLRLQLTRAEKKRLTRHHTENAEAYRLYLKGRHHWNRWTEEGFYKAIEYFQQAIEKDPSYALAYTGLADSYVLLGWNSYLPPKEAFPKGKAAAMTALQLDPDLAEAHTSLAALLWLHDWQWEEAQTEFKRSLELSPTYPTANHWYAEYVMTMGRHEEAMARMKNGQELDPLSLIINVAVGWAFYHARRYDEAIEQLRRTVELDPNYPVTYWILGLLLRKTGCYELAITEGEKGVKLSGGSPLMRAALAHTLGAAGRTKEALQILDDLTKLAKQKYVAPYFFAGIHIGLGENDRAIEYLEKCLRRAFPLAYLSSYRSEHGRLAGQPTFPRPVAACRPSRTDDRHSHLKEARHLSQLGFSWPRSPQFWGTGFPVHQNFLLSGPNLPRPKPRTDLPNRVACDEFFGFGEWAVDHGALVSGKSNPLALRTRLQSAEAQRSLVLNHLCLTVTSASRHSAILKLTSSHGRTGP